jgi:hypothetical protein
MERKACGYLIFETYRDLLTPGSSMDCSVVHQYSAVWKTGGRIENPKEIRMVSGLYECEECM